jgi:hypothetical protein
VRAALGAMPLRADITEIILLTAGSCIHVYGVTPLYGSR